jgi:hypothetical protein
MVRNKTGTFYKTARLKRVGKNQRRKLMKPFLFLAATLFIGSAALAQDSTPVASNPTPQAGMNGEHPRFTEIHNRIMKQRARIEEGVKSGKLTADEAKTLRDQVKAVGEQMRSDFEQNKQSGHKGLTDEQVQQLNQMLDESSQAIFGDKHEGAAATPTNP